MAELVSQGGKAESCRTTSCDAYPMIAQTPDVLVSLHVSEHPRVFFSKCHDAQL